MACNSFRQCPESLGARMKDRTYEVTIALICVALALAGIYYMTADSPIWNKWKDGEQTSTMTPSSGASEKKINGRLPLDGSEVPVDQAPRRESGTADQKADVVITKQDPGEEIDIRPPLNDKVPETGKELIDRIPTNDDWI